MPPQFSTRGNTRGSLRALPVGRDPRNLFTMIFNSFSNKYCVRKIVNVSYFSRVGIAQGQAMKLGKEKNIQ
jgi:hypothetical protein